jgi:hypothetical protein
MRLLAEILFWAGRLEIVALAMLVMHAILFWRWRHDELKRRLTLGWLALFIVLSATLFRGFLGKATDGIGYITAHLYGRIWRTDEEALYNILLRWRNILLPTYMLWLGTWFAGIGGIQLLGKARRRFTSFTAKVKR